MGAIGSVISILRDFDRFGSAIVSYHVAKLLGRPRQQMSIRRVGTITVRPGNSDLFTFRRAFFEREFDLDGVPQRTRLQKRYEDITSADGVPVIIDAGANVGAASLWFARAFPRAKVIAVEPDAENAQLCRVNVASNPGIQVVEAAIGGTSGNVDVRKGGDGTGWSSTTVRRPEGEGTAVYTVGELLALAGPDAALFLVKIDIEGFEADLFSGDTAWVDSAAGIYFEPHDWMLPGKGSSQSIQKALLGAGFEILARDANIIFVRDENLATESGVNWPGPNRSQGD